MKKITISLLSMVFIMNLFSACSNQKKVIDNVSEDKLEKTFTIGMKDTLKIKLKSNPTTGFEWQLANKIKPKVIKELDKIFIADDKSQKMVGAGGTDVFSFVPKKKGEVFLQFTYARTDGKAEKEKFFKVIVQ